MLNSAPSPRPPPRGVPPSCRNWMRAYDEPAGHEGTALASAGVFCIDGRAGLSRRPHQTTASLRDARTPLPARHHRLLGQPALDGRPFFVVTRPVDPGLLTVLREDIVPRLLAATCGATPVVATPTAGAASTALSTAPRFTLIFDREGYAAPFLQR